MFTDREDYLYVFYQHLHAHQESFHAAKAPERKREANLGLVSTSSDIYPSQHWHVRMSNDFRCGKTEED